MVVAVIGKAVTPWLRDEGLLGPNDAYRKVGFLIALGKIMGAAAVDLVLIFRSAIARFREKKAAAAPAADDKNFSLGRLGAWVAFWAIATVVSGATIMKVPVFFLIFAIALCFLFILVNGISLGISDSNPISSAFVLSVVLMAVAGLSDPGVGLLCGAVLLVAARDTYKFEEVSIYKTRVSMQILTTGRLAMVTRVQIIRPHINIKRV